jgi:hypothetical protein
VKVIAAIALGLFAIGVACVSFDLDGRRFRCDGTTNTCDPGYACNEDGYCAPLADASPVDARLIDGATGEMCTNNTDDDGDGHIDCADSECPGTNTCGMGCTCPGGNGQPTEVACADGKDNDRDALPDCQDLDCPRCQAALMCCPDGACRPSC